MLVLYICTYDYYSPAAQHMLNTRDTAPPPLQTPPDPPHQHQLTVSSEYSYTQIIQPASSIWWYRDMIVGHESGLLLKETSVERCCEGSCSWWVELVIFEYCCVVINCDQIIFAGDNCLVSAPPLWSQCWVQWSSERGAGGAAAGTVSQFRQFLSRQNTRHTTILHHISNNNCRNIFSDWHRDMMKIIEWLKSSQQWESGCEWQESRWRRSSGSRLTSASSALTPADTSQGQQWRLSIIISCICWVLVCDTSSSVVTSVLMMMT